MTEPRLVAGYKRFSPRKDAEKCLSIETQSDRLHAWCDALGWRIVGEYEDRAKSGGSMKGRVGLDAAIKHACRIKGVLLVYSFDRLNRELGDACYLLDTLHKAGADLSSVCERIDTTTDDGRTMYEFYALLAGHVRRQIKRKTRDAMQHHQKNGRRMGRPERCPWGTQASESDSGAIEPCKAELLVTARIVALRAAGEPLRGICEILDAEGFDKRGQKWAGAYKLVSTILEREGVA